MKQSVAPACLAINIITFLVIIFTVSMMIGSFFQPDFLAVGIIMLVIVGGCYLYAPVAYEMKDKRLTVFSRINKKEFDQVIKCSAVVKKPSMGIRLWGNGGLFAGTGIFWNKQYGVFRAYVTRSKLEDFVLVKTAKTIVLISPEKPKAFIAALEKNND